MPHFSKRDPEPRPAPRRPEFRAPLDQPRRRGATDGPDVFAVNSVPPQGPRASRSQTPDPRSQTSNPPPAATELPGSRSGPARHDEVRLCGLTAVRARFARDPGSIQRLFFDYATGRQVGVMSKVLAQTKKIYRCVEPAELEKIAGTMHHGGIVAVVTARTFTP